jgi:cytosine/uracil/thiamine/allantoin permease
MFVIFHLHAWYNFHTYYCGPFVHIMMNIVARSIFFTHTNSQATILGVKSMTKICFKT